MWTYVYQLIRYHIVNLYTCMYIIRINAGSQYDARPCVSLRCISVLYCEDDALLLTCQTQRNARIGSDSIFASAVLRLTNQFSEFYHNTTDAKQGLRHIVNQTLVTTDKLQAIR